MREEDVSKAVQIKDALKWAKFRLETTDSILEELEEGLTAPRVKITAGSRTILQSDKHPEAVRTALHLANAAAHAEIKQLTKELEEL